MNKDLLYTGRDSVRGRQYKKDDKAEGKRSKSQARSGSNVPNIRCYHYKREGHTRRFCPDRQKGNRQDRSKEPGNATLVEDGYKSAEAVMVSHENTETEWILDSGCSFHMTPNKSWFEELDEQVGGSVLLGNYKSCKIIGIRSQVQAS